MALQDVGALFPQLSGMEEQARGEEDMRGVEAFIGWCMGNANLEIRRVAGLAPDDSRIDLTNPTVKAGGAVDVGLEPVKEDWLTQLKKKHAKTKDGEESRWAGTVLGRDITGIREGGVKIEGWGNGGVESIEAWTERFRHKTGTAEGAVAQVEGVKAASESSSPLSEISVDAR